MEEGGEGEGMVLKKGDSNFHFSISSIHYFPPFPSLSSLPLSPIISNTLLHYSFNRNEKTEEEKINIGEMNSMTKTGKKENCKIRPRPDI
jgi:hypothetical protein